MVYREQRHRYVYKDKVNEGHIVFVGTEIMFCGIEKESLGKKSELSALLKFRADQDVCLTCQKVLKMLEVESVSVDKVLMSV